MEISIDYIFEQNKKNTNRFIEALKRDDRIKLDNYFEIAHKNGINLFDYTSKGETPFEAIIKLINKELKNKSGHESEDYLSDLFSYLYKNGFCFYQEKLINDKNPDNVFPYFKNYYNLRFNFKPSLNEKIDIDNYILKFSAENESIQHVSSADSLINNMNDYFLNNPFVIQYIKKLYQAKKIENIFKIKPYYLSKITSGKNKAFSATEHIIEEIKKGTDNKGLNDYIMYNMCEEKHKNFLYNLVKKDNLIFDNLLKIVLSWDKFNMDLSFKIDKSDDYFNFDQYDFLKESKGHYFKSYLEKLVYFNEHSHNKKMQLDKEITNPDNYVKMLSYFKPSRFSYDNDKKPEEIKKDFISINLVCNQDLLLSVFKDKAGVHKHEKHHYEDKEVEYLLKNWVKKEDVQRNIGLINIEEMTERTRGIFSFNNIQEQINSNYNKIRYMLELHKDYVCDFLYSQKVSEQQKIIKMHPTIEKAFMENKDLKIERLLNINNFKNDYRVNEDELSETIIKHLENKEKSPLSEKIKQQVREFCDQPYRKASNNPAKFTQQLEVIILYAQVRDAEVVPKNKKRL